MPWEHSASHAACSSRSQVSCCSGTKIVTTVLVAVHTSCRKVNRQSGQGVVGLLQSMLAISASPQPSWAVVVTPPQSGEVQDH